jgi:hypothetical protein
VLQCLYADIPRLDSGLTPTGRQSKASAAPQYDDFPASLRIVLESQALKQAGPIDDARIAKSSRGVFASIRGEPQDKGLPQPPLSGSTDGFWRKIRASTRPKDSMEGSRSTSRCESRATRLTCEDAQEVGSGKHSRWLNRIRENAAKMVGQTASMSRPPTVHLQRPSMTVDEDQGRYKGSLDAAMALADGLRGYPGDATTTDCDGE